VEQPGVRTHLDALSNAAGLDLLAHGTTSDAATITDTAVAQPLIVATGLLAAPFVLGVNRPPRVGAVAGHSVGELTAAAVAGVLTEDAAMTLVARRGRAMAEASAVRPTGMSAVLGGDADEVLAVLARCGLTAANVNGAGQVVAAGTTDQLAALAADPPPRARVVPLQVAGAFHTTHMAPAVAQLAEAAAALEVSDPGVTLLSNRDGAAVASGAEVRDRLVAQVSSPVRWDRVTETLASLGVTAVLELPPAGTLTGLAKRALPGVELVALKTPDDLEAARRLVEEHA
jgi:[acyl-carrier-protein] S-malonyltransferase